MKRRKFKLLIVLISILLITITIFVIRHKIYNNIEEDWIIKISPNYLNSPANTVYLYKDSYIITHSFITNDWQDIVHKRGKLTYAVNENLITKIKKEAKQQIELEEIVLPYKVTLKSGEKLTLTNETEVINEIVEMINYDGKIWYATIDD